MYKPKPGWQLVLFRPLVFVTATLLLAGCATQIGDQHDPLVMDSFAHSERFLVGVMKFDSAAETEQQLDSESFSGILINKLQDYGRFRLVEHERIQSILDTQAFQLSGHVDPESIQAIGQLLGVEALCFSTIDRVDYSYNRTSGLIAWIDTQKMEISVSSRIVSVASGEVLSSAQTTVTRGRKHWVAFGFMKLGGLIEKPLLFNEAMDLAVRNIAADLSMRAPHK